MRVRQIIPTFLLLGAFCLAVAPVWAEEAQVLAVIDGDSLLCEVGGIRVQVRLRGLDAPEYDQEYGDEAEQFVVDWVDACGPVNLEYEKDKWDRYDRLLAWVWCPTSGALLNTDLVAAGLALPYYIDEGDKHAGQIHAALATAEADNAGFWARGGLTMTPHDWRKNKGKNQ